MTKQNILTSQLKLMGKAPTEGAAAVVQTTFSFTDCQHDYRDNKNLYAMMLPSSCRVTTINPRNTITVPHRHDTDLKHTLVLSKLSNVIIMYQYTGNGLNNKWSKQHMVLRIKNKLSCSKAHCTVSIPGYTYYYGNFGLWQGPLNSGSHRHSSCGIS